MKIKGIKIKPVLGGILAAAVLLPLVWGMATKFEGESPAIDFEQKTAAIGKLHQFTIHASDRKSGLRKVWVGLLQDGREISLLDREQADPGGPTGRKGLAETFRVTLDAGKRGLHDGKVLLRMAAWDRSWRGWLKGNRTYVEKEMELDTRPPVITVLTKAHNLTQGGAGLVIYRLSESCPESGVTVGENFFSGQPGFFKDPNVYLAFIALGHSQPTDIDIYTAASDAAGNRSRTGFPHYIRKRTFKKDTIGISDRFLNWKMPEFESGAAAVSGISLKDKFLKVNRDIRKASYQTVAEQVGATENRLMWNGAFLRLPGSARKAGFADRRAYVYKGEVIDNQIHQGVDLASLAQSPVPAANTGKVVFTGPAGIYGNTVILDHGFGLFSLYAHLSAIETARGNTVSRGDVIGRTGVTGLAGGDHLHFGMLIRQVYVNPVEWWDPAWIENNIMSKIRSVKARLGEG